MASPLNVKHGFRLLRIIAAIAAGALTLSCDADAGAHHYRLVYVSNFLRSDGDIDKLRATMERAIAAGYNGIVLRGDLDRVVGEGPEFHARLEAVRELQDELGIVVIPQVFSTGYAGFLLESDRNLAAAMPVRDQLFVVDGPEARLVPDHAVSIANGGFEERAAERVPGIRFQDRPGETTIVDRSVARSGRASLRFENFDGANRQFARAMYEIAVRPFRSYRIRFWLKTEDLAAGSFLAQILVDGGRTIMIQVPSVERTSDWQRVDLAFNSLHYEKVLFYAGVWSGNAGRFWIDDLQIEEVGLLNVLRRPGTPVTLRGEDGQTYIEGEDYEAVADPQLDFSAGHDGPAIRVIETGRIEAGERLRVDYYQALSIRRGQIAACLSEPRVYELLEDIVDVLEKYMRPSHYFIGGDEIRHGGWCRACEARGGDMAEIIGTAFQRQFGIIRERNHEAEVLVWADMLDPAANAHDDFFLVHGDIAGSWRYAPKDMIAVVWEHRAKEASFRHFENLGMRTLASIDAGMGGVENLHLWLGELAKCEKGTGVMYTTWRDDFSKLEAFGAEINRVK